MTITPLPELTPILKQLRLSGLLDSLDTRNRETIKSKLTYPEFLALVIQDEAERRDQSMRSTNHLERGSAYSLKDSRSRFQGSKASTSSTDCALGRSVNR